MTKLDLLNQFSVSKYPMNMTDFEKLNLIGLIHFDMMTIENLFKLIELVERSHVPKEYTFVLKDKAALLNKLNNAYSKKERKRQRDRIKAIREVNGFYTSSERGAKIHMTKIKGRYL